MNRLLFFVAVLYPFGLWSCSSSAMEAELPTQETTERSATIDAVLSEIQAGVDGAQSKLLLEGTCAAKCPRLETVQVTLQTVLRRVGDSGFEFLIFSFGRRIASSQIQTVVLNLKPPSPRLEKAKGPTLSTLLSTAIVDAVQGVERAEAHESVPLQLDTFAVEIGFVVSVEDTGGLDSPKVSILPIDIDFKRSDSLASGNTHKARLTFGRS